ncbi:MAG: 4Fe-4S binding protein, partial [Acidimicrobiia bacterium]
VLEHPRSPVGTIEIREEACTACTMCAQSCPTGALAQEHEEQSVVVTFDGVLCVGCGQCLRTCPEEERGAIVLSRKTDFAVLNRGRTLLLRDQTTRCTSCGSPIAPKRMMERIEELLGSEHAATLEVLNRYCLDCRGRPVADERVGGRANHGFPK